MTQIWTAKTVRETIREAFAVLLALPSRDSGPSTTSTWWPDSPFDPAELSEIRKVARRQKVATDPQAISRMEKILIGDGKHKCWLREFLADEPGIRRVIVADALWSATATPFEIGCRRKGWAYSTTRRNRDKGAKMIAERLNAAGSN